MYTGLRALTCFRCNMKYSEWYIWLFSESSTQIHQGSEVMP